jgi:hypothetical protein
MQAVQLVPDAREAAFGYRLRSMLAVRLLALFSVGETWKPAGLGVSHGLHWKPMNED